MRRMNVGGRKALKRERIIGNARNACDMRTDFDSLIAQQLNCDAARNAQRSGKTTRKMAAARNVLRTVEFHIRHVIGVARSRHAAKFIVIGAFRIRVSNKGRKRRAARDAVDQAAQKFRKVGLFARSRPRHAAWRSTRKKRLQLIEVNLLSGRYALDHAADAGGMALSEDGHADIFPNARSHAPRLSIVGAIWHIVSFRPVPLARFAMRMHHGRMRGNR